MTTVHCTTCGTALVPHDCGAGFDWLECPDPACDCRYYDVHRGTLLKRGGIVTRWSEA